MLQLLASAADLPRVGDLDAADVGGKGDGGCVDRGRVGVLTFNKISLLINKQHKKIM